MQRGGQRSNRQGEIETLIDVLVDTTGREQRAALGATKTAVEVEPVPERHETPLRQGVIQTTVFSVLAEAGRGLRTTEIHASVERRLGRSVSYDTVSSCLSVAARDSRRPVLRCGFGLYAAGPSIES
jgi:hypothetical protein